MLTSKFALEKYRAFPYIAWGTVICFSLFAFHLTQSLIEATSNLRLAQAELETNVHMPVEQIRFPNATTSVRSHK
jgi:hypothetical protein